jgi:hypothetical protein
MCVITHLQGHLTVKVKSWTARQRVFQANATKTATATATMAKAMAITMPLDDDIVSSNYIQIEIAHIVHEK